MRWIIAPLLWIFALGLALVVLWRLWRGKNVILRGKWSPRLIRMVAIVLVVLGVGGEKGKTAPIPRPPTKNQDHSQLPKEVNTRAISGWLRWQQMQPYWIGLKQNYEKARLQPEKLDAALIKDLDASGRLLPQKIQEIFRADVQAMKEGKAPLKVDPATLFSALEEIEKVGFYDHWLIAYVWRLASANVDQDARSQTIKVFARLHQQARVTDTLIRANALVKPVMATPQAWRSKSGRVIPASIATAAPAKVLETAQTVYKTSKAGTWDRDGLLMFRLGKKSANCLIHRGGRSLDVSAGDWQRLGRLDLLQTPKSESTVVLEHQWLGEIELPADRLLSVWELAKHLSKETTKKIEEHVAKAVDGEESIAELLEMTLPLTHQAIRTELRERPRAKGAARMRLILALFDDAVMPRIAAAAPARRPGTPLRERRGR